MTHLCNLICCLSVILCGICRLIEKSISSAYALVCEMQLVSGSASAGASFALTEPTDSSIKRSFIDLPKELFEMLASVGPYLYRNTILLQKVYIFIFVFVLLISYDSITS